ncbi:hypothetical protein C1645_833394 [Glomus cerebriforme]|uniref:Transposase putative helix-turn-helix domain-containing protein n=1 Tax=Glomus cerebriforme TaxID=658196 RepID=A0A397SDW0_9GLOM|nr:hypothetical protein C1645_833394 [Glomus cerebriforme]
MSPDPGTYWNSQALGFSQCLWVLTNENCQENYPISSKETAKSNRSLQNTWFSSIQYPLDCGLESKVFLPISTSSKSKMKRKTRSTSARNTQKKESTTINHTIQIRVYPNKSQAQILKRWLGLSHYAYNAIIGINRKKKVYSKECKCDPSMVKFLKPMSFESKMKLFSNVKADKDSTPEEDLKLQKNSV